MTTSQISKLWCLPRSNFLNRTFYGRGHITPNQVTQQNGSILGKRFHSSTIDPNALKQKLLERDYLLQSFSSNLRFAIINNTNIVTTAKKRHHLNSPETILLGRTLAAVSLFSSFLNGEERVKAKIVSEDESSPIRMIEAESIHVGEVRGYVDRREIQSDNTKDIGSPSIGSKGLLTVSKVLYGLTQPMVSTVETTKGDVTSDFANFLSLSDQIPSVIDLDTKLDDNGEVLYSGGLFVQTLPYAPPNIIKETQQNVEKNQPLTHLQTLSVLQNTPKSDRRNLYDLIELILPKSELSSIPPRREMVKKLVDFHCRCSKDAFARGIVTLGRAQLEEWIHEGKKTETVCHYCNTKYEFGKQDLEALLPRTQQ